MKRFAWVANCRAGVLSALAMLPALLLDVAHAQGFKQGQAAPEDIYTESYSEQYRVICADVLLAKRLIDEVIIPTRRSLARLLALKGEWKNKVLVRIEEGDDPTIEQFAEFGAILWEKKLAFTVRCLFPSRRDEHELRRGIVYALLYEKVLEKRQNWEREQALPILPVWLIEGAVMAAEGQREDLYSVVSRAVRNGKAPTLDTILSWEQIDEGDPIVGAWQRSFAFYLFDCLTQSERRRQFGTWLGKLRGADPTEFQDVSELIASEIAWRSELADVDRRRDHQVFSFGETARRLDECLFLTLANKETGVLDRQVAVTSIHSEERSPELIGALRQKIKDLTELEMRAHTTWRESIRLYRFALTEFVTPDNAGLRDYARTMLKAKQASETARANRELYFDYLNWYVFTRSPQRGASPFQGYYDVRRQHDRQEEAVLGIFSREALKLDRRLRGGSQ